jgi:hypothetical protein
MALGGRCVGGGYCAEDADKGGCAKASGDRIAPIAPDIALTHGRTARLPTILDF